VHFPLHSSCSFFSRSVKIDSDTFLIDLACVVVFQPIAAPSQVCSCIWFPSKLGHKVPSSIASPTPWCPFSDPPPPISLSNPFCAYFFPFPIDACLTKQLAVLTDQPSLLLFHSPNSRLNSSRFIHT
jgi:hypothetical protein